MKKTFFKLYEFLNSSEKNKFSFILLVTFLTFILEFVSLFSIPAFFGLITENELIIKNFEKLFDAFNLKISLDRQNIIYIGIIIIFIFFVKNLLSFFLLVYENKFCENVKNRLTEKLYSNFVYSDFEKLISFNPSNISRTVSSSVNEAFLYMQSIIGLFKELLAIIAIFLILLIVNPQAVIIIFVLFSIIIFNYFKFIKPFLHNAGIENQNLQSKIIRILNETFGSIKELRVLNKENEIKNYFLKDVKTYNKNFRFFNIIQRLPKILLEVIFLIVLMLVTIYFFGKNQSLISLMPEIILYTMISIRFIPAFNSLSSSFTYIKIGGAAINIIFNDLKKLQKSKDDYKISKNRNIIYKNGKDNFLTIKNLFYQYPNKSNFTLENINVSIDAGSTVVITGSTGSGKTTLMNLILGFLKPTSGNILHFGKNIQELKENWFNKISYVSQSCYLMDTSIKNNITFNFIEENVDHQKLEKAIKLSNLSKFVESLPQKENTLVGNDGVKISGGERQRIAIARAIYKNSNIVFMDEFSSALDAKTEENIFKNFLKEFENKTIITISHRENIIKKSDVILNMTNKNLEKKINKK